MSRPCGGVIGLDVGTSGCRALAVDAAGVPIGEATADLPPSIRDREGGAEQQPEHWWASVQIVLGRLLEQCAEFAPSALCLDATSATVLLCDPQGRPLGSALMYDDSRARRQAALIDQRAPRSSAARGASSSLAKTLFLLKRHRPPHGTLALHQADWLAGRLTGRFGLSDWNNSLKMGFDPIALRWPEWLERLPLDGLRLPEVVAPGADLGPIAAQTARAIGLPADLHVLAPTTDSTAAALAAGAAEPGDAVTSLGSTLVLKVVADAPVVAPEFGVYSHRVGGRWLVGGASNAGGAVMRQFFSDAELATLSQGIDPLCDSGLDYYPLPGRGERFPINDPLLEPRLQPRPDSDIAFLHALLEGIARIERAGYQRLQALGAPWPRQVATIGGGAGNPVWTRLRARLLGVPVQAAERQQAAYGAARLAFSSASMSCRH